MYKCSFVLFYSVLTLDNEEDGSSWDNSVCPDASVSIKSLNECILFYLPKMGLLGFEIIIIKNY